jgi:hypothetical protein
MDTSHVDFAYVSVSEVSFRLALDDEGEAVLLGGGAIDGEFHGEVPFGVRAAVFVCGCLLLGGFEVVVSVDFDNGVDVHLGEKIHVLHFGGCNIHSKQEDEVQSTVGNFLCFSSHKQSVTEYERGCP